jgi:DNA-directed RNA polymerase specialized sigma subunit
VTAKKYLNQARKLNTAINTKVEELHQLQLKASCVQSVAITERVMSSRDNSGNKTIDKIVDLQNEINAEVAHLVDLQAEIRAKIANVYNLTYISVLTNLYINCLTIEKTAEKMGSDRSTICRWHGQALQVFRKENKMV